MSNREYEVIGWREWARLPELGVARIKVKVDTGAKTSALHAEDIEVFTRPQGTFVRFTVYPKQRNRRIASRTSARLVDERHVRSSIGVRTRRPVIETQLELGGAIFPIQVTLVDRDVMGFRMLLGRQALRGRYLVDPGTSFLCGRLNKSKEHPRQKRDS